MKTVLLDKLPPRSERVRVLQQRIIMGVLFLSKAVPRTFKRKIVCSGSPMNSIDFKMRKKHGRKIVAPVIKYYEVKSIKE